MLEHYEELELRQYVPPTPSLILLPVVHGIPLPYNVVHE